MKTKTRRSAESILCPRCGSADWSPELNFCVECANLDDDPIIKCPKCGSDDYNSDIDFCLDCTLSETRSNKNKKLQKDKEKKQEKDDAEALPNFTEDELTASICKASLYEFVQEFWEEASAESPVWNWHIEYLCEELQKVCELVFARKTKLYDLIINIAPGTGKSTICSILLPAWCWIRMAHCRIIGASYSHQLSIDLSRKSRDIIKSSKYQRLFPNIRIRLDQDTKGYFINSAKGDRFSAGVNGMVTGMHGHIIIVDDPLNPQQALSEAEINNANTWMSETLPSRRVPPRRIAPMIIIMQRLHQNDPTGFRLERSEHAPVKHICLPAEVSALVTPAHLKSRYLDGLMDPVLLDKTELRRAYADLGPYGYAAQYNQSPVPRGGALFQIDKLKVDLPPARFKKIVRFWDKAGTLMGGNFTVGCKIGEDFESRIWILDIIRGQWDAFRREKMIQQTAILDGKRVRIGIESEGASGGKESAENTVRNLRGYVVTIVKVGTKEGSKIDRADPLATQVNSENVYLAKAHWNAVFRSEMEYFPKSKYDDQIDAAAGGFNLLMKGNIVIGGMGCLFNAVA